MKTMIDKWLAACTLCAGLAIPAWGQTADKSYTLEQCRTMALEHNIKMKNAKNNLAGAEQTRKEAFTNYFPTVSATGMGYNANEPAATMALAPGMELALLKNGLVGGVTAVQPVFTGGQIINGNKLAKVGVEVSKLQLKQSENEVNLTAEQYYWQVITLKEKQHTLATVDTMLNRLLKDVSAAVDAGVTTRNDLLQVQLKKNEIACTRINLDNGLSLSKRVLAQYMGVEGTDFELVSDISMEELPAFSPDMQRNHSVALIHTPEYNLLEKNVEANKLQQKLSVGKNMPTVGVGAGYMYHNLLDRDESFGLVFASVSVPLSGWWGGSHAIKRQKLQVKNAENELTDKSELLVIRMQQIWNDLENAYKQLGIAHNSIEQATENLRLNNDYYQAGTTNMSDLLKAQSLYQQSKDRYVDAYSQYQTKILEYRLATW